MKSTFDERAKAWDNETRIERAKIIANEISQYLPLKPTDEVLEFGCGTGLISFNLLDRAKHYTLLDNSEGMIDVVKEKIAAYSLNNITALCGELNSEQLRNKRYNAIYTSMAFHHVSDIKESAKLFSEIIADNGYLCIVDLVEEDGTFHKEDPTFTGYNGFNVNKLITMFQHYGLTVTHSNIFYTDIKIVEEKDIEYSLFILIMKKVIE